MVYNSKGEVKKSLYLFLTSLLGVLLFLILHRIVVFLFLYLVAGGYITTAVNYGQFLFWDYFTMVVTMMLGAWYGIWLGLYWFEKVYEEKSHRGLVNHIAVNYFSGSGPKNLEGKISDVKRRLESDLWQLENLAKAEAVKVSTPEPVKRRAARKTATKKLKSIR